MSLISGLKALRDRRYQEAADLLGRVGTGTGVAAEEDFIGAQVGLVAAYEGLGKVEDAVALRQDLEKGGIDLNFWSLDMVFSLLEDAEDESDRIVVPPPPDIRDSVLDEVDDDITRPLANVPLAKARQNLPSVARPARPAQRLSPGEGERSSQSTRAADPENITQANLPPLNPTPSSTGDDRLLQSGHQAVLKKRYADAIRDLEAFGKAGFDVNSPKDQYALMALIKAYRGNRQIDDAIAACRQLTACTDPTVQTWVDETLSSLYAAQSKQARYSLNRKSPPQETDRVYPFPKSGRAPGARDFVRPQRFPKLIPIAAATLGAIIFIPTAFVAAIIGLTTTVGPWRATGIGASIVLTVLTVTWLFSGPLLDRLLVPGKSNRMRWSNWPGLETYSKEAADVLKQIGRKHQLPQPRLGVIDSPFPFIATYGALPSGARIVASKGLLSLLDDAELAVLYAREYSHIVRWDFAIATEIAIGSQLCYRLYAWGRSWARRSPEEETDPDLPSLSPLRRAQIAIVRGIGLMFYALHAGLLAIARPFNRARTYHADHFAAEATGNPNDLARTLFKLAYGIAEAEARAQRPNALVGGLGQLGPLAMASVPAAAGAYRSTEPQQIGRWLLWEMFSPWAKAVELSSEYPLLGKRLQAIGHYTEQLSLPQEFDLEDVLRQETALLDRKKLLQPFYYQFALYYGPVLLIGIGALATLIATVAFGQPPIVIPVAILFGFATGTALRALAMFPGAKRLPLADTATLAADPYLSLLQGRLTRLQGKLVGRADTRYSPQLWLQLQDSTGAVELRYTSQLGVLGNLGAVDGRLQAMTGQEVTVAGWYRRSDRPWLEIDKIELRRGAKKTVKGYPRYWAFMQVSAALLAGVALLQGPAAWQKLSALAGPLLERLPF